MAENQEQNAATDAADQWSATMTPPPKERAKRLLWPWVLLVVLLAIAIPVAVVLHRVEFEQKPWDINYAGVTWQRAVENVTTSGKPYLGGDVQFSEEVVSAADFQNFLAALVEKTKGRYVYYEIFALNKTGRMVLKGYVADDGRYSITPTEDYTR